MMWLLIIIGVPLLAFFFWSISKYETACTGECEQGRRCNCLIGKDKDE
jgi:hypothetical protein